MSGLLFLTSDDFQIQQKSKGNVLCHNIKGFSLILFYSTQCEYCKKLIPIFKELPGTIQGCNFGMLNVNRNKKIIQMSNQTIVPITYVPYCILFIDGVPFMRYDGPSNKDNILTFIVDVANKVENNRKFISNKDQQQQSQQSIVDKPIPEYSLGRPLCGPNDKKCYLKWESAYKK